MEADAGAIIKIVETPVVAMAIATTAKKAEGSRMAWTSTSVVETPTAVVAKAKAAKTAEWAWISVLEASAAVLAIATASKTAEGSWLPTPGPFRKSRETLIALVKLMPQLRPFDF